MVSSVEEKRAHFWFKIVLNTSVFNTKFFFQSSILVLTFFQNHQLTILTFSNNTNSINISFFFLGKIVWPRTSSHCTSCSHERKTYCSILASCTMCFSKYNEWICSYSKYAKIYLMKIEWRWPKFYLVAPYFERAGWLQVTTIFCFGWKVTSRISWEISNRVNKNLS